MPYAKRIVLPGYPKEFVFQCREDVDAYLSGDRIECLLCGMMFKSLGPHLNGVHSMEADEYKEKYGLPYKRGLSGEGTKAKHIAHGKAIWEENREVQAEYLERAKAVQLVNGNPQRNKPSFWKNERTKFKREDYEEFIRRVIAGRGVKEVSYDDDMPHSVNVYWYMKRHKDFAEKYRALIPLFAKPGLSKADRQKQGLFLFPEQQIGVV